MGGGLRGPVVIGSGGGGFQIGSSYLFALIADSTGNASGATVHPTFTLDSSAGSDLDIDGMDATKINVSTTGWYSLGVSFNLYADTATLTLVIAEVLINGIAIAAGAYVLYGANVLEVEDQISYPAIRLTAADVLSVSFISETSAGTWSSYGAAAQEVVSIVRLS